MIYLDNNATTPCDPSVVKEMLPFFENDYANASSNHALGWMAKDSIEKSDGTLASVLGILQDEIIFTSGATEGINMILKGVFESKKEKGNHIVTSKTEHKAVLDTCKWLESHGASITYLDVDENGLIDLEELESAINTETILVAIMLANNETGIIQPLEAISQVCKKHNAPLFSDATQALGKISLEHFFEQVDYACFSAHKLYGPKGVGFNYIKKEHLSGFKGFIQGGGQQRKLRGGTYNTPLIIGLAKAVELAHENFTAYNTKIQDLRNRLEKGISKIEGSHINGKLSPRLPGTLNISFEFVDGEQLLTSLATKIAVSNGSACTSASVDPSHVLTAMGLSSNLAFSSIRFGVGKQNTEKEIDAAIELITEQVRLQRENNILWARRK